VHPSSPPVPAMPRTTKYQMSGAAPIQADARSTTPRGKPFRLALAGAVRCALIHVEDHARATTIGKPAEAATTYSRRGGPVEGRAESLEI